MSDISETIKTVPKEENGFFKYITTFDDEQKCELMNIIQYSILAIIPVILILRSVKALVPDEDESKGSLELSMECILQIIYIMVMLWVANRIIRYIPTYSQCDYEPSSHVNFILPFLLILATMQSKLGFKLNIMADRILDMWHGKTSEPQQPVQGQQQQNNSNFILQPQTHQPSQSDYLDTNNLLPSNPQHSAMPGQQPSPQQTAMQQSPDFNAMYAGPNTPLVDAENAGGIEPMAANDALGGGGFSSW
jgi:hypothetical protein